MRRKTVLVAALAALMAATVAVVAALALHRKSADRDTGSMPRPVASIIVDDAALPEHSVPGTISAKIDVALGFQTLGRVTARNVDVGSLVRQGDVLATLNPDDLQGDVRAAQAEVEAAAVEMVTARATAERTRALVKREVASTAQLEQAERALAAAMAADQQARSELIRALDAAGFAEIKAPFDGVISAVHVNAGAVVSAGEPVIQLSAQEGLEAVIDLPEAALSRVKIGDPYEVWAGFEPNTREPARITQIEPVADPVTRTRRIHLALDDDASFRLGALIRARPVSTGAPLLSLPRLAILNQDGQEQVWIVHRDGARATVDIRNVETSGLAHDGHIDIAAGLSPGDEVVIRGIHSLTPGQPVGRSVLP
ncbi:efflux RND transporter periplasmic adaptor subunit [Paracoccus lutimaris]|uniref:RND family efflux transporter MFP subunit n=1 Tax=Paracoccus lutimaris TaxID=1490030 RepID=A0A368YTF2_9RHOB|nr:efflux RND transporter periplasmic adaptor subunit [Paracoccus lutimaris]RCW82858.1 RND family efflux transporter MFP subunit [Paracoccus lutimaris]